MLKPTKDWIIVEVIVDTENITDSGIVLLSPKKAGFKNVKIIDFGPEANPTGVLKVGDTIMCVESHGIKVDHEDKKYEFMREENFLGIVE